MLVVSYAVSEVLWMILLGCGTGSGDGLRGTRWTNIGRSEEWCCWEGCLCTFQWDIHYLCWSTTFIVISSSVCLRFIISPYLISHSSDLQSNPCGSPRVSVWVEIGNHLWIIGLYNIVDHHDGFVPQYILTKPSRAAGISTFVGNRMQVVLHKADAEVSKRKPIL